MKEALCFDRSDCFSAIFILRSDAKRRVSKDGDMRQFIRAKRNPR